MDLTWMEFLLTLEHFGVRAQRSPSGIPFLEREVDGIPRRFVLYTPSPNAIVPRDIRARILERLRITAEEFDAN